MTIEIFHQLGHNFVWNFQSHDDDSVGDGYILAPSHIAKEQIDSLPVEKSTISIFDPQFFLPNLQIRSLSTYDFFPDRLADGFTTSEFANNLCYECAKRCVQFQIQSGFNKIIIPTRYLTGMPPTFIQQQEQLFVSPFIDAIDSAQTKKPVILQLILNDNMIKNEEYASEILNWITGIQRINGVYLIIDINPRSKQIKDIDFLFLYLKFIRALRNNDLYVLLGYQNIESTLLSLADPNGITIGSYENLRMFNIRNFENRDNLPIHGPNARIYVSKLLQWIDNNYIGAIRKEIGDVLFDDNQYRALMFQPTYRWHFTKPELYKHFFLVFSEQINKISNLEGLERFNLVLNIFDEANQGFALINKAGVALDINNDGSHISTWITAANLFGKEMGWRK